MSSKHPCPYHDTLRCRIIQLRYYFRQLLDEIACILGINRLICWLNDILKGEGG